MAKAKRKKSKVMDRNIEERFDADIVPSYDGDEKKAFKKQGKLSFFDEFYTLYRRWVKNE